MSHGTQSAAGEAGAAQARLEPRQFEVLAELVTERTGIRMPPSKRLMMESRLRKRLRVLGLSSFEDYCRLVLKDGAGAAEQTHLIDAITTNKTDFFREPQHFDVLVQRVLPALDRAVGAGTRRPVSVWSAGCSTGEEPYTLAMVLSEYGQRSEGFRFSLLATDVSTEVLARAQRAVYAEERVAPVSEALRRKYLMRSKDRDRAEVRIVPELRAAVTFRQLNFMDTDYGLRRVMDVIFCRNVLIYFDRPTQERIINRLCACLIPNGYLFLGHSESTNGLRVPLRQVAPTVHQVVGA